MAILLIVGFKTLSGTLFLYTVMITMKFSNHFMAATRWATFFCLIMLLPTMSSAKSSPIAASSYSAFLLDDTIPEFLVISIEDTLKENYPAVYSPINIALSTIPTDTVLVIIYPDMQLNIGGGVGEADTLIFPPYPAALLFKEIKVKPFNDAIYEDYHTGTISFAVITNDTTYDDFTIPAISYVIEDNDLPPGLTQYIPIDTFLTEGLPGIDMLFALTSVPTDTVFITVDPDNQMRITGIPGEAVTLVFPPNGTALSLDGVGMRAVDDVIFEGPHSGTVTFSIVTADAAYAAFTIDDVIFPILDNDNEPAINYTVPAILDVNEGLGEIEIAIALNSVPFDTVKITVIPDDQLRIAAGPGEPFTLVFAPNTSALNDHIAIVKAYDDLVFEGDHFGEVAFEITTTDADYAAFVLAPFTVNIADNDLAPGIIFDDTTAMAGTEGDSIFFDVYLASIPAFTVTINLDPDNNLDLGKGKGSDISLKFKEDSALLAKKVKMTIFDDPIFEGFHIGVIVCSITTSDTVYDNYAIPDIIVNITDNDLVSIVNYNPEQFAVFPTVSQGAFNCNFGEELIGGNIDVYDVSGSLVERITEITGQLQLNYLPAGNYTLIASKNEHYFYQRIIIAQ